jgi:hypothetical protein
VCKSLQIIISEKPGLKEIKYKIVSSGINQNVLKIAFPDIDGDKNTGE